MEKTTEQRLVLSAPKGTKIAQVKMADDGNHVEIIIDSKTVNQKQDFDETFSIIYPRGFFNEKMADDGKSIEIIIAPELVQEIPVNIEDFPIFDPKVLSGHKLLEYEPRTKTGKSLKENIYKAISMNLPAFRAPIEEPSTENGRLVFKQGNLVTGHSPIWWKKTYGTLIPSKNSRIGTDLHWSVFLGIQMKNFLDKNPNSSSPECLWNRVDYKYDTIGYNIPNVSYRGRILEKWGNPGNFLLSGGYGRVYDLGFGRGAQDKYSLAHFRDINFPEDNFERGVVGWFVMDV